MCVCVCVLSLAVAIWRFVASAPPSDDVTHTHTLKSTIRVRSISYCCKHLDIDAWTGPRMKSERSLKHLVENDEETEVRRSGRREKEQDVKPKAQCDHHQRQQRPHITGISGDLKA